MSLCLPCVQEKDVLQEQVAFLKAQLQLALKVSDEGFKVGGAGWEEAWVRNERKHGRKWVNHVPHSLRSTT